MAVSIYRPTLVNQLDGSRFASYNCTCASAATALDRHTLGKKKTTGARVRSCQFDMIEGTDLIDVDTAWNRCFGSDLDVRHRLPWTDFIRMIKEGRGAIIQGNYGSLPSQYRHIAGFFGGHATYVNEVNSMGWLLHYDSLWIRPEWIPASIIKRYAGTLRFASGNVTGDGYVNAAFTGRLVQPKPFPIPLPIPQKPKPENPDGTVTPSGPKPVREVDTMIAGGGLIRTSSHVKALKKDQPLYFTPGGKVVSKMAKDGKVDYFGVATTGWHCIQVNTATPYKDKKVRPTLLYVPSAAGPVTAKK